MIGCAIRTLRSVQTLINSQVVGREQATPYNVSPAVAAAINRNFVIVTRVRKMLAPCGTHHSKTKFWR